jgi:uncharacterized SAM-binding protein YcdF (DUF218 family)
MEQSQVQTRTEPPSTGPSTTTRRRRALWVVAAVVVLVAAMVIPMTFNWFVNPPTEEMTTVQPADAVVLFAGAAERLDTAVELMERGAAPNLVLPNGNTIDDAEDLCEGSAPYQVFCPASDEITTKGEAVAIGRLAEEQGWSRLIAVTSVYHVHRATFLLGRCFDGPVDAVTPSQDLDTEEWVGKIPHEWAGFLAALVLPPAC